MTATYLEGLDRFVAVCHELVDKGMPYMAVVLSHELVRFLYPYEPTTGFTHVDPVPDLEHRVVRLARLGESALEAIVPYAPPRGGDVGTDESIASGTSALYTTLWQGLNEEAIREESAKLLRRRLPAKFIEEKIRGKRVADVGCGSGRYTLALAAAGAAEVTGVDYRASSFARAEAIAERDDLPARFVEGNALALPFESDSYDFVFSNGVIHHTTDMRRALDEIVRVMAPAGSGFLYVYGSGGIFWETRARLREVFAKIPYAYTAAVFAAMRVPGNRFIFADTWYVPIERHTTRAEIEAWLRERGLRFEKVVSEAPFDLDGAIARGVKGAAEMWGDGEHRYVLEKPAR